MTCLALTVVGQCLSKKSDESVYCRSHKRISKKYGLQKGFLFYNSDSSLDLSDSD